MATKAAMIRDVNLHRAGYQLRKLLIDQELMDDSQAWAQDMADHNRLIHGRTGADFSKSWSAVGENVGVADPRNWPDMMRAFIASPGHNANMLRGDYNRIGVGVATTLDGRAMYVCFRFAHLPTVKARPPARR
jgi:uncharacterized protein YkwD